MALWSFCTHHNPPAHHSCRHSRCRGRTPTTPRCSARCGTCNRRVSVSHNIDEVWLLRASHELVVAATREAAAELITGVAHSAVVVSVAPPIPSDAATRHRALELFRRAVAACANIKPSSLTKKNRVDNIHHVHVHVIAEGTLSVWDTVTVRVETLVRLTATRFAAVVVTHGAPRVLVRTQTRVVRRLLRDAQTATVTTIALWFNKQVNKS